MIKVITIVDEHQIDQPNNLFGTVKGIDTVLGVLRLNIKQLVKLSGNDPEKIQSAFNRQIPNLY